MTVDIEGLRTFLAIHRAGGFARASETLHRSQPAISRRIAQLEDSFGVPLFERAPGGIRLSMAGETLVPHAETAIAAFEDCGASIAGIKAGEMGRIAIAAVGTLAGTGLTPILEEFRRSHPAADLTLRTATSREVSDLVRTGEATLGLRYHADASDVLACEKIAAERLVVACRPDHPRLKSRSLHLLDLAEETWLAFPSDAREAASDTIFAEFLVRGHSGLRWTAIDSLTAQKRLVEAGLGLALLPESAIEEERRAGSMATLPITDLDAANPVYLVTRRESYLNPAAQTLIGLFRSTDMFPEHS